MRRTWPLPILAIVVALAAGYWYWSSPGERGVSIDLVEAFRGAQKQTNVGSVEAAFNMDPQTIGGVTKPAIYMHPASRVTYKALQVPKDARLRAWLAIKEEAWDKGTDGVYFRIGISANGVFTDHVKRHLDPFRVPADRAWVPVDLDLSQYADQTVDVIFNTEPSAPGYAPHAGYDFAVIGAPAIVVTSGGST